MRSVVSLVNSYSIYEASPVWAQNVCCTLYGLRQFYLVYGGRFQKYYNDFRANETLSSSEIESMQMEKLRDIFSHACMYVPYYQTLQTETGVAARDLNWESFRSLPILEKERVRSSPDDFVSTGLSKRKMHVGRTSGTTGSPLAVFMTADACRQLWAAMERMRTWAGVSARDGRASVTGRVFVPTSRDAHGIYWRHDRVGRRLLLSVYHLNDETVSRYAWILRRFQPTSIDGYPSAIGRIASFMRDNPSERVPSLRAAFPTAETLTPEIRELIEEGLDVKVRNQYGSTEGVCHVAECEYGNLHVSPEIGVVEILDEEGRPSMSGTVGHLVLTGLVNYAMPLIRYKIGDMAVAADKADANCQCGRTFPVIGAVVGRNDDLVRTPDGRLLPIMNYHMMKWASGVKEALLVQEDYHRFKLVVVRDNSRPFDLGEAVRELEKRMGCRVALDIVHVDRIPVTERGKLRGVISKVPL